MGDSHSGGDLPKGRNAKRRKPLLRGVFNVILLVGLFWLGLNIGNGTLSFTAQNQTIGSNNSLPADLDYAEVERLYDVLRENYDGDLTVEELVDGLKTGLVEATGDPYTEYFNAENAEEFNEQLSGSFSGIGAELGKDSNDNLIVVSPIRGFPAEAAGLRAQDIIVSIDDESTQGLSINEAVTQIRGPEGTDVKLGILRGNEPLEITITRETINIPSVEYEILEDNVGYIELRQFWTDTAELTQQAAREFKQQGVKKVVLDLRGNPGGSLEAAVDVSEIWLQNGDVILEERRDNEVIRTYQASGDGLLAGIETVVLIDQGSASASEIVAGALKDNDAARLVGQTSFGKGSVQQIITLRNGAELKVTIARWFTPEGKNIDKEGIKPDREVEYTLEDAEAEKDPQLDAALDELADD